MYLNRLSPDWAFAVITGVAAGTIDALVGGPQPDLGDACAAGAAVAAVVSGFSGVALSVQRDGDRHRLFEQVYPGLLRRTWIHGIGTPFASAVILVLLVAVPSAPWVTGVFAASIGAVTASGIRVGVMLNYSLRLTETDHATPVGNGQKVELRDRPESTS